MPRWFAVPILAVALFGCGGDDDTADEEGSAIDAVTTTAPETTAPSTAPETTVPITDAPESTTSTTLAAMASGSDTSTAEPAPPTTATTSPPTTAAPTTTTEASSGDCLVGNWVITQAEMNAFYDTLESQMDVPVDFTIVGQTGLDFTTDTYEYNADFDLMLDAAGVGGTGASTGTVSGTYVADDGVIVTTLGSSSLNVIITVAGQTVDGSSMANGLLTSVPINDAPYTCENGIPVLMFKTADEGVLHPVTLTPA